MKLITQIQRATDGESWNLYVNGVPAVTYESFQVCCNVEEALRNANPIQHLYSEGAEVAEAIRASLKALSVSGRPAMRSLLLILLLVAGCSQAPKPQTSATWQQDDETAQAWADANRAAKEARHD